VNYSDDRENSRMGISFSRVFERLSRLSQLSRGVIVAIVASPILYFISGPNKPLTRIIDAPTYIWSSGCPNTYESKLVVQNIIPCGCANERYRISNYSGLGIIKSGRGSARFYRIGNDVVQLVQLRNPLECRILTEYRNIYEPISETNTSRVKG
jgi:hypothetical protein